MKLNIKKVKIGSSYYDIKYIYDLRDIKNARFLGFFNAAKKLIEIDDNCLQTELQALLHECIHGIVWDKAIKIDDEEKVIEPLASGLYALIIDNPKFIQKILDYTKKIRGK